jgi:anti-sigma regulatory factor (Ser/Thr protein kinase)
VIVEADTGADGVVLEVRDSGAWVERPDGPLPYRGHGLPLMEALVDTMDIERSASGTTVRLRRQLACQATEECSSTQLNGSGTRASASPSEGPSST